MSAINVLDASVILVSFNTRELLRESLMTVRKSDGVAFETIVVDNASHDGHPPDCRAAIHSRRRSLQAWRGRLPGLIFAR